MSESSSFEKAEAARGTLRQYVEQYLRHRPGHFVGEFLDEEGWNNPQAGIGGTCFIAFLEAKYGLPVQIAGAWPTLATALAATSANVAPQEAHLLKDVPRIPVKSVLLALGPDQGVIPDQVIKDIFAQRDANGLLKAVLNEPTARGDAIVTCYVFQVLKFSGRAGGYMTEILSAQTELRRLLRQGDLELYERLYVSTTLCLFDFANNIDQHRSIVAELYASDLEWHRAFSSNSPFLDYRYADPSHPGLGRNRYVRVPVGYIVMSAIYITIGDERKFFNFAPVRKLITDIRVPFSAHVGRDKNKASVYYVWFTYLGLHPSLYLDTPRQPWLRRVVEWFRYQIKDLTLVGGVVVLLCFVGIFGVAYFTVMLVTKGWDQFSNWLGAVGTALGAVLGLMKTRKR